MEPDITAQMFTILRLDPNAHIELSTWTGKWFVQSNLGIGDGAMVTSGTEHRDNPEEAVDAFLERLSSHGGREYITNGRSGDDRRNWRFTGVMFREVGTEALRAEFASS